MIISFYDTPMIDCDYFECLCPAIQRCEECEAAFCSDHGTGGGDRQVQDVGAVAVPGRCWKHGGFNADE
jgi:hypothetical protein